MNTQLEAFLDDEWQYIVTLTQPCPLDELDLEYVKALKALEALEVFQWVLISDLSSWLTFTSIVPGRHMILHWLIWGTKIGLFMIHHLKRSVKSLQISPVDWQSLQETLRHTQNMYQCLKNRRELSCHLPYLTPFTNISYIFSQVHC